MIRIFIGLFFTMLAQLVMGQHNHPIDVNASREAKALFHTLCRYQSEGKTIFGQHDAILYGREWEGASDRSDVKDLVGSHPGVIGIDLEKITHEDVNYRRTETQKLIRAVKETYRKQGIVTVSWHMFNPGNGGSFYWEKNPVSAVAEMIPGGKYNDTYRAYLQLFAKFLAECQGKRGEPIPLLFRPFHEMDGDWFWWGKNHCSPTEYIKLWRYTVDYLRHDLGIHQLLYVFSPDCKFVSEEDYLERYPGDEYVDVLGMDNYWDFRPDGANNPALAEQKLDMVRKLALEKRKVVSLTEFGLEGVTQVDWFTSVVGPILQRCPVAYAMVWRNAHDLPEHYYTPTGGHPAVDDFKIFLEQDNILLQRDLIDTYLQKN